jgi:hypothetical protein
MTEETKIQFSKNGKWVSTMLVRAEKKVSDFFAPPRQQSAVIEEQGFGKTPHAGPSHRANSNENKWMQYGKHSSRDSTERELVSNGAAVEIAAAVVAFGVETFVGFVVLAGEKLVPALAKSVTIGDRAYGFFNEVKNLSHNSEINKLIEMTEEYLGEGFKSKR